MTSDKTAENITPESQPGTQICVLGGDARQSYIAQILSDSGFRVSTYATVQLPNENSNDVAIPRNITRHDTLEAALSQSRALVLPFPLSPDGVRLNCGISEEHPRLREIFELAAKSGCRQILAGMARADAEIMAEGFGLQLTDYGKFPEIAIKNAIPTAEGALAIAMREIDTTVRGTSFAVVGYGKCGSAIARLTVAMGGYVYGVARSETDRAKMYADAVIPRDISELPSVCEKVAVIFNTVPAEIFDEKLLSALPRSTVIIDIASAPGGVDTHCAASYGIKAIHAASLPGKYAPLTAARIICDRILPALQALQALHVRTKE